MTLYSAVRPALLRTALFKGTFIAAVGVVLLVGSGSFLPPNLLSVWGLPILFIGIGLMAWGLIPYRRLQQIDSKPHKLVVVGDVYLQYQRGEKALLTVPLEAVERLDYLEDGQRYGIELIIRSDAKKTVKQHQAKLPAGLYFEDEGRLFFPYFTRRSFTKLVHLNSLETDK